MRGSRGAPPLDRRGEVLRTVLAGAVLALAACASAPGAGDAAHPLKASDIRALRWIAPGADKVQALTTRPVACANAPIAKSPDSAAGLTNLQRYEVGRLAFESPALLGGAAGRMGLSCSSCHLNGRDNADFFLDGVSDAPGRADVTSNLLSKIRGDGAFNPTRIPDLAKKDGKQIRERLSPEFRTKVRGLVVEEFDGQEPEKPVFDALVSFMNAQDVEFCVDPLARTAVHAKDDIADAKAAMELADALEGEGDRKAAMLMGRIARERLGVVHEKFVLASQGDVRNALVAASRSIETWMSAMPAEVGVGHKLDHWETYAQAVRELDVAGALVLREEPRSLYNPDVLRAALAQ